jgi:hypothetical protein
MAENPKGDRSAVIKELLANQEPTVSEPTHTSKKTAPHPHTQKYEGLKKCQTKQGGK